MATFVFVHGAWHGGWCWAALERVLQARGHETHALTLTGLGERSHLLHAEIDADLHVQDVVNTLHWRDLKDVVLVGHSYGGLVITGAAGQVPERIQALVYLDAVVPEVSGESLFSKAGPERIARFLAQLERGAIAVDPDLIETWTEDPKHHSWLRDRCTPHPIDSFRRGVTLTGREHGIARKLYILAAHNHGSLFWSEYDKLDGRPGWMRARINAKHDAMLEKPSELADLLHDFACSS